MDEYYAIIFEKKVIKDGLYYLMPKRTIRGNYFEDFFVTGNEKVYDLISFETIKRGYRNLCGLPISVRDLLKYYSDENINEKNDIIEEFSKCYFSDVFKYSYIINEDKCVAVNLEDDRVFFETDMSISFIELKQASKLVNESIENPFDFDNKKNDNNKHQEKYNFSKIFNNVKRRVVGQDEAVRLVISGLLKNIKYSNYEGMKTNMLIYGPSGCGKTEIIRSIARELDVPMAVVDATSYTANGYVGESINDMLRGLYLNSGCDEKKAEHGIIVIDEFDKIATIDSRTSVNRTDVQNELLKMIEGSDVSFFLNGEKHYDSKVTLNTTNITFVLVGAFSDIYTNDEKRQIGFIEDIEKENSSIRIIDNKELEKFGIIPEIIGRISIKIPVRKLLEEDYKRILTSSSISSLKVYEKALKNVDSIKLCYNNKNEFISRIAEKAVMLNIGARGIKTVVDEMMLPILSELGDTDSFDKELVLSEETIEHPKKYVLKKKKSGSDMGELSSSNG